MSSSSSSHAPLKKGLTTSLSAVGIQPNVSIAVTGASSSSITMEGASGNNSFSGEKPDLKLRTSSVGSNAGSKSGQQSHNHPPSAPASVNIRQTSSGRTSDHRRSVNRNRKSGNGSDAVKGRLHHLFDQIEKEFDLVLVENAALKERVDALEEVLLSNEVMAQMSHQETASGAVGGATAGGSSSGTKERINQKLTSQLKRDSMVAASQISQKIKSTYKLKTSGKIFNKLQHEKTLRSELLGKYEFHKDGVWYVTATHRFNRLLIATSSADGTAHIMDLTNPYPHVHPIATYVGHLGCSVNCVRFHPKYDLVLTASGDSGSHIWRPNFDQMFALQSLRGPEGDEKDSPDEGHTIRTPLIELTGHTSVVVGCDWLSTVDQCVTASWDRTANLYDINTGEIVMSLSGHDQELTDVTAHPTAPLVVTSSNDTTFRLWDFRESIHSVCVFQGHTERVNSTNFVGQDKVVSGSDDRTVKLWDLRNMRSPLANIHLESPINRIGVSQNGHIAVPLENRNVRVYDSNGNRLCRLPRSQHERMVTCAAFAPSSSLPSPANGSGSSLSNVQLFTCGFDRKVCWWNLSPGEKS